MLLINSKDTRKFLAEKINDNYQQIESFVSLNALIKPGLPLPTMRKTAISPDMANILATLILRNKPQTIVECGSGVSTIITGYCLERNSVGYIWSLDHEEKYAKITGGNLVVHGLERYATVLHANTRFKDTSDCFMI
jgi:predicted O-methyltransferase YrrM